MRSIPCGSQDLYPATSGHRTGDIERRADETARFVPICTMPYDANVAYRSIAPRWRGPSHTVMGHRGAQRWRVLVSK